MKKGLLYLLPSILSLLLIGGSYATWQFYNNAQPTDEDVLTNIDEWYFEENLPGGGEEGSQEFNDGISHADIIKDIVRDIEKFLNQTDDSLIIGAIEGAMGDRNNKHNGVGSSTKYNGVTLRDFAGAHGYDNLGFFIYYGEGISEVENITSLEVYTYALDDSDDRIGTYIEAYKTIINIIDDGCRLIGGWKGTAALVQYGSSNTTGKYKNVINPKTWTKSA